MRLEGAGEYYDLHGLWKIAVKVEVSDRHYGRQPTVALHLMYDILESR